ncbi:MAG: PEP-utilizing enzyme [Acidimicrobiales bacterium]
MAPSSDQWKPVANGTWVGSDSSERFPVYTRGNAGEVYPNVFTPLSFSLAAEAGEQAMRNAMLSTGLVGPDELASIPLSTAVGSGVFSGYAYLNLSIQRIMSGRAPGGSPLDADANFLGVGDAPPHQEQQGDKSWRATIRGTRYVFGLLKQPDLQELIDDQITVEGVLAALPDRTTASDQELRQSVDEFVPLFAELFERHLRVTAAAGVLLSVLSNLCSAALKDDQLAVQLLSGLGDVDSAAPSAALWDLGQIVAADADLSRAFDAAASLPDRRRLIESLRQSASDSNFVRSFDQFITDFGSRGPNEWDTGFDSWETDPGLPMALIDRMRLADDDHNPRAQRERLIADQIALAAATGAQFPRPLRPLFTRVLRAARAYSQGRERAKTTVVKAIHGQRLLAQELDRRLVERSGGSRGDLWFVVMDELDDYLATPGAYADTIASRRETHRLLSERVPPFFFSGAIPPVDEWELRTAARSPAVVGEVFTGLPGCLGTAIGRARVVLDPSDPGSLGPGDVLVAPITDPSWTPLFVPAEAVVVDVGAVMSHAVIVSRELGIPCVVSATDATRRIPDGALIKVDGTAGTVTILELPAG